MSINALEVLEARMGRLATFAHHTPDCAFLRSEGYVPALCDCGLSELMTAAMFQGMTTRPANPSYHTPEWWDMMWAKHEQWRNDTYPAPADQHGYEVTPASGKVLG